MRLTIGRKLTFGFGIVILLMAATALIVYAKVQDMNGNIAAVVNEAYPTIGACDRLMNGVNQSSAALRGYILNAIPQKAQEFRSSRADGWSDIERQLQKLVALEKDRGSTNTNESMEALFDNVEKYRVAQQTVEDIAHTADNVPAQTLAHNSASPVAEKMLSELSAMLDEEVDVELSSERRNVMRVLADSKSSLQEMLGGLRHYVWSGDRGARDAFHQSWDENEVSYQAAHSVRDLLTATQRDRWERYSKWREEFSAISKEVLALREADDWHRSNYLFATESMPRAATIRSMLEKITADAVRRKDARVEELVASSRELMITMILATLLAVGIGTVVAVLLSRQIIGAVSQLAQRAQQIASGDLTGGALENKSADELGELADGFDVMLLGLRDLTGQIRSVTENVNSAATQISSSATQQAVSSKEQAATVQEITSTMQEISQSGMQIVEKAREVASTAEATAAASQSGMSAVQTTNKTMRAIREQVEEVAENIVSLSEKTQAVGDIIATVTDVAEQSNLLALNATIEAAEAGNEGNRFSVVASEMKNLADQAKGCTVQVRTILSEIQKGINSAVMLTEEAVKRVELGKQQAEVSEESIRQMSETTKQSVQAFQQIIAATNQQQVGFDQVTQGMRDIDQATQQSAAGTSQLDQAVLSLSSLSQQLKTAVATYRV